MKSINEKSKEWCSEHSNKGCTEQCDGCWQLKQALGCEQHNMETAYKAGANYVLDEIEEFLNLYGVWCMSSSARAYLKDMIEQLKSNQ